jgi:hypothetical protein
MKILSVDIGLIHLALVGVNLPENYIDREEVIIDDEVYFCELIDITQLINECDRDTCKLYHDKIICDYMSHLFEKYAEVFNDADKILIERQPPMGFVAVQELIMFKYRNKSKLISPNAMLSYFGILHFDYEVRKTHTESIAMDYLSGVKMFMFNERRHDMADAFCMIFYFVKDKKERSNPMLGNRFKCFVSSDYSLLYTV